MSQTIKIELPPPPPRMLAGRFLKTGEIVRNKDLIEISWNTEVRGSRYREVQFGNYELPYYGNYWVFRPFQRYLSDNENRYLCPIYANPEGDEFNGLGIYVSGIHEVKSAARIKYQLVPRIEIKKEIYTNVLKDDFDCIIEEEIK